MDWARCEMAADGLLDHPVDVVTALIGIAAGMSVVGRGHPRVGGALIVSGVASAGYHAWTGAFTGWLDGVGVALIAFALAADAGRWPRTGVALGGVGVVGLTGPEALRPGVTAAVVLAAAVLVLARERVSRDHLAAATALFATGLLAWWAAADTSRCSADGWLPLHAVWHVTAVLAVSVLVVSRQRSGPAGHRAAGGRTSPSTTA